MADREPVEVTVEIGGEEVAAGTLWINEQRAETATFRYSDSYLASPVSYDLDPTLPKSAHYHRMARVRAPGLRLEGSSR
jgi:serine/threonine-protein kinase HipA